jgi:hypothetical protein
LLSGSLNGLYFKSSGYPVVRALNVNLIVDYRLEHTNLVVEPAGLKSVLCDRPDTITLNDFASSLRRTGLSDSVPKMTIPHLQKNANYENARRSQKKRLLAFSRRATFTPKNSRRSLAKKNLGVSPNLRRPG